MGFLLLFVSFFLGYIGISFDSDMFPNSDACIFGFVFFLSPSIYMIGKSYREIQSLKNKLAKVDEIDEAADEQAKDSDKDN